MKYNLEKKQVFETLRLGDTVITCSGEKATVVHKGTLKDCLENGHCNDEGYTLADFEKYQDWYERPVEELDAVCVVFDNQKATFLFDESAKILSVLSQVCLPLEVRSFILWKTLNTVNLL